MTYTDEEIIKALDTCADESEDCANCPFRTDIESCNDLIKISLAIIKRQRAEIERLKGWENLLKAESHAPIKAKARAEAIKEFAERLKEKSYPFPCAIGVENAVTIRAINDLVKEMTQEG